MQSSKKSLKNNSLCFDQPVVFSTRKKNQHNLSQNVQSSHFTFQPSLRLRGSLVDFHQGWNKQKKLKSLQHRDEFQKELLLFRDLTKIYLNSFYSAKSVPLRFSGRFVDCVSQCTSLYFHENFHWTYQTVGVSGEVI